MTEKNTTIPYIEIQITDNCNLNCKGCSHFSPLIKDSYFITVKEFEHDLNQLKSVVGDKLSMLCLLGGEPLLHSDLVELCKIARKYFPSTEIKIDTNGILLPLLKQNEIDELNKNEITIRWSDYHLPTKDEIQLFLMKNIRRWYVVDCYNIMYNLSFHFNADTGIKKFHVCQNNCLILNRGVLYHCPDEACNDLLLNNFNIRIDGYNKSENSFPLEGKTLDDLFEFMRTPSTFCRYCSEWDVRSKNFSPWQKSKKELIEWTMQEE